MQSEYPWFSHDCNARNDRKVRALRAEMGYMGYACFFMLLELLREEPSLSLDLSKGHITRAVQDELGVTALQLDAFLKLCTELELIQVVNQVVSSGSFTRRVERRMKNLEVWRSNGKMGGRPKKPSGSVLVNQEDNQNHNQTESIRTELNRTELREKPNQNQVVISGGPKKIPEKPRVPRTTRSIADLAKHPAPTVEFDLENDSPF